MRAMRSLCSAPMARQASPRGMRPCSRGRCASNTTRVAGGEAFSTSAAAAGGGASLRLRPHGSNSPACCHHADSAAFLAAATRSCHSTAESRSSVPLLLGERLARRALGERLHAADPPLSSCTRQTVHLAALQPSPPPAAASYPPQPQPSPLPPPQPLLPPPRS